MSILDAKEMMTLAFVIALAVVGLTVVLVKEWKVAKEETVREWRERELSKHLHVEPEECANR